MKIIGAVSVFLAAITAMTAARAADGVESGQYAQANSPAESTPVDVSKPVFLQGGVIEHAERLPAVDPNLQAGALFNAAAIPQPVPNNDWYWIPSWYAGTKHVDTETILQEYDYQSGRSATINRVVTNRQDLTIGFQSDRNGQIWEFKRAPYNTVVEGDSFFTTMLVRNRDPLKVEQAQVVVRLLQTSVSVDKRSRRILKTLQEEQINTYTPVSPGVMSMQTSIKSFAADGSPLMQETSTRMVATSAPFSPVNLYEGKDMRALFQNYMLSHGFGNLLPDDLKPAVQQEADTYPPIAPQR